VILAVEGGNSMDDLKWSSGGTSVPAGLARLTLRNDGTTTFAAEWLSITSTPPALNFSLPARRRRALAFRVSSPSGGRMRVSAVLHRVAGSRQLPVGTRERVLQPGETWSGVLPLGTASLRTARRWLRAGAVVTARVTAEIAVGDGWAESTRYETRSTRVVR
jgi:hypothetical protein